MIRRRGVFSWAFATAGAAALAWTSGLSGCGFALRRPPPMPFARIALRQFAPRSGVAEALTTALRASCEVVDDPRKADVVLVAHQDRFTRTLVASSAAGQVREVQLRVLFHFHIETSQGRILTPRAEMMLSRDLTYNESAALAKELEEAHLVREMQADIALQLSRRLASLSV